MRQEERGREPHYIPQNSRDEPVPLHKQTRCGERAQNRENVVVSEKERAGTEGTPKGGGGRELPWLHQARASTLSISIRAEGTSWLRKLEDRRPLRMRGEKRKRLYREDMISVRGRGKKT